MLDKNTNLEDLDVRVVKFDFMTSAGAGTVTVMVNTGITIDGAGQELLDAMGDMYDSIEITGYEILEIIPPDDSPLH